MRIATFLPHVGVFGGVRRYLELGNAWARMGHDVTLFHPEGTPPTWLPFRGHVLPTAESAGAPASDVALASSPWTFEAFRAHRARRHVYYCVLEGDEGLGRAIDDPGVTLAANSGPLRRALERCARRRVIDGIGGIDPVRFHPARGPRAESPLRILLNGRRSRAKKGTDLVLTALRGLGRDVPAFEIVLFDSVDAHNRQDPRDGAALPERARFVMNPTQDELVSLYQSSHVFVAAERKAGWCNTALEALACGCALVCTRSGTTDFARNGDNALVTWRHPWFVRRAVKRLLVDPALRIRLATTAPASVQAWNWDALAAKLLAGAAPDA